MQIATNKKSVKDYILSEEVMKELRKPKIKQQNRKKSVTKVKYCVILQADCDFIVEKQKGKNVQQLVILVSQRQYYIQTSEGRRELLKATNLRDYLKDVKDELMLPDVTWLSRLKPGSVFANYLIKVLRYDDSVNMIRKNLFYLYDVNQRNILEETGFWHNYNEVPYHNILNSNAIDRCIDYNQEEDDWGDIFDIDSSDVQISAMSGRSIDYRNFRRQLYSDVIEDCYGIDPEFYTWIIDYMAKRRGITRKELFMKYLFAYDSKEKKVIQSYFAFLAFEGLMGKEWAKKAVMLYLDSEIEDILPVNHICGMYTGENCVVKCNGWGYYRDLNCKRKFKADSFLQYLFVDAVKEGFADDLQRFLFIWNDVLGLQERLDGKIKEKYPKNLVSFQCKLAYDWRKYQSRIKEERWRKAACNMEVYEYKNEKYQIVCPKNGRDLIDEGRNQHNCVKNYEGRILEGEEMIFFMRKNECLEHSLVTIELFLNGDLGQIFRSCNQPPSKEELEFIKEWAKVKNLRIPDVPLEARA